MRASFYSLTDHPRGGTLIHTDYEWGIDPPLSPCHFCRELSTVSVVSHYMPRHYVKCSHCGATGPRVRRPWNRSMTRAQVLKVTTESFLQAIDWWNNGRHK